MDTERWQRVKDIFGEALDLPIDKRLEFVGRAAEDDPEIYQEVVSLLTTDDEEVAFLDAAPITGDDEGEDPMLGTKLGPWKLVTKLDSGGMGKVYIAERADRAYKDRVAIKVLKRGMDTDEVVRRFRRERQILAHLAHPYITRLMDGGSTPDGRPYLVMEYIEGEHITTWCRNTRRPLRERLQVFLKVCEGVSFAHSNLIVHRDLKPGNILITERGEPKLLDFGIAKLLDPEEGHTHTQMGQRLLTPAYAAPEQIRGEAITTACDVFALGVLLFEILVGELPERTTTGPNTGHRISVDRIPLPSRSVDTKPSPGAIHKRQLVGDLDTIVLKALREDPAKRYHSADELAEDIGRYLEGFPVRARRETVWYQMSKFFGRHQFGVTMAGLGLLMVFSLFILLVNDQKLIREERNEAQESTRIGQDVRGFLIALLGQADVTDEQLALTAARLTNEENTDPAVKAANLQALAEIFHQRGQREQAKQLLEQSLSVMYTHFQPNHPDIRHGEQLLQQWNAP